ncbi:MAG: hypothetical protein NVSMB13_13450 [Mycobacteriales bacterium]
MPVTPAEASPALVVRSRIVRLIESKTPSELRTPYSTLTATTNATNRHTENTSENFSTDHGSIRRTESRARRGTRGASIRREGVSGADGGRDGRLPVTDEPDGAGWLTGPAPATAPRLLDAGRAGDPTDGCSLGGTGAGPSDAGA